MKKYITAIVIILSLVALQAAEKKRVAFKDICFGVTQEENDIAIKTLVSNLNSRSAKDRKPMTARDVMQYFITSKTRVSPKLASKHSKIEVGISPLGGERIETVAARGPQRQAEAYATDIKDSWEVFRDIANSKFGAPTVLTPFPSAESFTEIHQKVVTDSWHFEGLEIQLQVASIQKRIFWTELVATDPIIAAENKKNENASEPNGNVIPGEEATNN
jgi:hypothetical protein